MVTGASGTVGSQVVSQLVEKGIYEITAFDVRNKNSEKKLAPFAEKIQIVYGDITDKATVEKIAENKDFVIHLAAIIPPLADDNPNLAYRVNVQGTKNLVESLEQKSPEAFFIYASSISVYGDRLEQPFISVGDALIPSEGDEYAKTKIETEKFLKASKLEWTIFRLAAIMGNHKISKLMFHMPLDTKMEICTPADTARAFVNAINHRENLKYYIFNLGGGEECRTTYREFLQKSFEIFGLGKLDFPDKAFAEKNFHCGYYEDGDNLEKILKFRRHTLADYFYQVKESVNPVTRLFTKMFKSVVKKTLLRSSEPYDAFVNDKKELKNRFFN